MKIKDEPKSLTPPKMPERPVNSIKPTKPPSKKSESVIDVKESEYYGYIQRLIEDLKFIQLHGEVDEGDEETLEDWDNTLIGIGVLVKGLGRLGRRR